MAKVEPHIAEVVGTPVPCHTHNLRSDNEASKRPTTVNLGGFYTPDTRRISYGSAGVNAPGSGGGARKSQEGKAAPRRGRTDAGSQT